MMLKRGAAAILLSLLLAMGAIGCGGVSASDTMQGGTPPGGSENGTETPPQEDGQDQTPQFVSGEEAAAIASDLRAKLSALTGSDWAASLSGAETTLSADSETTAPCGTKFDPVTGSAVAVYRRERAQSDLAVATTRSAVDYCAEALLERRTAGEEYAANASEQNAVPQETLETLFVRYYADLSAKRDYSLWRTDAGETLGAQGIVSFLRMCDDAGELLFGNWAPAFRYAAHSLTSRFVQGLSARVSGRRYEFCFDLAKASQDTSDSVSSAAARDRFGAAGDGGRSAFSAVEGEPVSVVVSGQIDCQLTLDSRNVPIELGLSARDIMLSVSRSGVSEFDFTGEFTFCMRAAPQTAAPITLEEMRAVFPSLVRLTDMPFLETLV